MTQVATRTPAPAPPARWNTRRSGWRLGLHWFGVVCLMVAAGFGGYVGVAPMGHGTLDAAGAG